MKKIITIGIVFVAAVFLLLFFLKIRTASTASISSAIFNQAKQALPAAAWDNPEEGTTGTVPAVGMSGTLTVQEANIPHFENSTDLKKLGFQPDINLSADGPGSSQWGYKKVENGKIQLITYSYRVSPSNSNPNEPVQFNCPCNATVSVTVSKPFSNLADPQDQSGNAQALPNPASANCGKVGGTTVIKNGAMGQYGLCQFQDNMACEEWALFRGQCPVGGVKTTGFDTIEQKYCAWVGGQTFAVPKAQCKLPSGKTCSDKKLYEGTCTN